MGDKIKGLFAVKGRANRALYWKTIIPVWLAFLIVAVLSMILRSEVIAGLAAVVLAIGLVIVFCVSVRRLHDREKSWTWVLIFILLPSLLRALGGYFDGYGAMGPAAGLSILALAFGVWGFVEMGCLKGSQGLNRYGADPLAPDETVEAFT
jgi:uncharacterized membrane protein YhaH (DUF805 family)